MYQVIDNAGQMSEPMDADRLKALIEVGSVDPQQMVLDTLYNRTLSASEVVSGQAVVQQQYTPPIAAVQPPPPTYAQQPVYPISTMKADPTVFGPRIWAYLIDALCAVPLMALAFIPFVGLFMSPIAVLYWISRDSFFGNQSIGKKALGLKVVCEDGSPFSWGKSVLRNIVYFALLVEMIPILGFFLVIPTMGFITLAELICVIATHKRIGDHLGKTFVTKA